MKIRCEGCRHNNKFWNGSGCNLQNNGEPCHFSPLNGKDLFVILAREAGFNLADPSEDECDEFIAALIQGCRDDGMSEEEIQKWLKEI